MVIGIDAHMLGDHSGGNESYYTNILRAMKVEAGDKVYLFVKEGTDVSEFKDKFTIVRFHSKGAFCRNFIELDRLCRKYRIDVLHTQYFIPFFPSSKIVCTIHDICFEHYKDIFTKSEFIRQKLLIPYAARHSRYIFTVSEFSKRDIIEQYHIDPDRIIITYNAVNDRFRGLSGEELQEQELREKYGIGKLPYVMTVGNLQPRKNLPILIRAFNEWHKESGRSSKLVIVGKKAWMYSDILRQAGTNENIILTDFVPEKDLVRLYNAAACFIYPSFYEGFGIPPLEAMACGTPVAVSNVTAMPEVVKDAGLFFDPSDIDGIKKSIGQLMENEDLRKELIQKGLNRSKEFSWNESASKIYRAYKQAAVKG